MTSEAEKTPAPPAPGDSTLRLVVVMFVVTAVAAGALAGWNQFTQGRIAASRARVKLAGIQRVLPRCDNDPVKDVLVLKDARGQATNVFPCRQKQPDGALRLVAAAIERDSTSNKNKTYSGLIQVLVGVEAATGKIRTFAGKKGPEVAVLILKHSETPGLGSKAEAYDFRKAYAGRDLKGDDQTSDGKKWVVKKDNPLLGIVDAISGATITSRAVTEIVQAALAVWNLHRDALLGSSAPPAPAAGGEQKEPQP
jgi:electron transport complex protein RnfG